MAKKIKLRKRKVWIIVLLILFVLVISAFYDRPIVRRYRITTPKIKEGFRIVHLSDLHNAIYGQENKKLITMVERQEPDVIIMTGDIIDDAGCTDGAELMLEAIRDIAPLYYVPGNHEYWTGEIDGVLDVIASYDVTILRNEIIHPTISGQTICIAGLDDPDCVKYDKKLEGETYTLDILKQLQENRDFSLIMAHRPEAIEDYLLYQPDLILSGHAHGGQVRIPLILNGLFAPDQGWFPRYAGGHYQFADSDFIVSRGLANNVKMPRIFNPPEVVVIYVLPIKNPSGLN